MTNTYNKTSDLTELRSNLLYEIEKYMNAHGVEMQEEQYRRLLESMLDVVYNETET